MRVDSEQAFKQSLEEFKPDIVLADYNLPAYNGRAALEYMQQINPELPVIMVTGAIGEERAAELFAHRGQGLHPERQIDASSGSDPAGACRASGNQGTPRK